jgi:hypothetical protein
MSIRCNCSDQGDETVFDQCRTCKPDPQDAPVSRSRLVDPPPLVPSWVFVVPAERPYETTLDTSELED